MSKKDDLNDARARLHHASADLTVILEQQGDLIAKHHGWSVSGLDAVRYHLMQKHHWTPAELFAMSNDHLHFAMSEEARSATGKKAGR